jgi:hypothetical protein
VSGMTAEKAIAQLSNLLLGVSRTLAHTHPEATQAFIGAAIYASRNDGSGDEILMEVWEKCFPGKPLPTVVSSDIMETMVNKPKP